MFKDSVFGKNPIVAIVGRPNIGKSALFNRIVGSRVSIVCDYPGVTRDCVYAVCEWRGKEVSLVDTGGFESVLNDHLILKIRNQIKYAIDSADVILFVTDIKSGITLGDQEIALMLRKSKKSVILCVNRCDEVEVKPDFYEFFSLGFGTPVAVSALHGHRIGDLLDLIFEKIQKWKQNKQNTIKVTILGKPNVGKSLITNKLCGKERSIVEDASGTTRDSLDTILSLNGQEYTITDTAGIRRNNSENKIEKYSVLRAINSAERSDVCLVLLDASEGITNQDIKIAGIVKKLEKSCIILVNKWDKLESNKQNVSKFESIIKKNLLFVSYAPILYVSAKTDRNLIKILPSVDKVYSNFHKRISTGILNNFLNKVMLRTPPPVIKGKKLKIYYITQNASGPPTFVLFVNRSELFHFSYKRHIENRLREMFDFFGTPLKLVIRQKFVK